MSKHTLSTKLPRRAQENLCIVGEQIRLARRRRKIPISRIAKASSCSELTVMRIEKGVPSVSMGAYLRVLYALQLDEDILLLAKDDPRGRLLQDSSLIKKKKKLEDREELVFD